MTVLVLVNGWKTHFHALAKYPGRLKIFILSAAGTIYNQNKTVGGVLGRSPV